MPRKPRRHRRAIFLESLEDRRLLAVLDALDGLSPTAADGAPAAYDPTSVLVRFRETEPHGLPFEVLRTDDINISVDRFQLQGSANEFFVQVHDPSGVIHDAASNDVENTELSVELSDAEPGTYLIHIFSADGVNIPTKDYNLRIATAPSSSTRIFYVNDEDILGDFYADGAGNDANDGLTPQTPKRSVQSLLAQYDLGPDDLVLIDTGAYDQGSVIITADDEGAAYAGSPGGSVFSAGSSRWELVDADFNLIYGLTFDGPQSGIGILARNGSTNNDFFRNRFNTPATNICSICWGHTGRVCFLQFAPDGTHRTELFSAGDTPQGSEVFVWGTSADYSRRHQ